MRMAKRNRLLRLRADIGTVAPRAYEGDLDSAWVLLKLIKDQATTMRLASRLSKCNVTRLEAQRPRSPRPKEKS
jgi:hypothetical protein